MWQMSLFTFAKPSISCGTSDNEINEVKCSLSSIILISEKYITTVKTTENASSQNSRAANPDMSLYFRSSLIKR